jgi:hypothetical protein
MKKSELLYDAFLICTVREADKNDLEFINDYLIKLKEEGKAVYYPAEDTEQVDSSGGYQICSDNCQAIMNSKEIHVYWTKKSEGTKFDLGIAFGEHRTKGKNIILANRSQVERIVEEQREMAKQKGKVAKSFEMVLLKLDDLAKQ